MTRLHRHAALVIAIAAATVAAGCVSLPDTIVPAGADASGEASAVRAGTSAAFALVADGVGRHAIIELADPAARVRLTAPDVDPFADAPGCAAVAFRDGDRPLLDGVGHVRARAPLGLWAWSDRGALAGEGTRVHVMWACDAGSDVGLVIGEGTEPVALEGEPDARVRFEAPAAEPAVTGNDVAARHERVEWRVPAADGPAVAFAVLGEKTTGAAYAGARFASELAFVARDDSPEASPRPNPTFGFAPGGWSARAGWVPPEEVAAGTDIWAYVESATVGPRAVEHSLQLASFPIPE